MKSYRRLSDEKNILIDVIEEEIENKLSEYQKANAPLSARSSRLDPYKHLIERLFLDCYSHGQIADFLFTVGVPVHSTTVGRFISKKLKGLSTSSTKNIFVKNNPPDNNVNLANKTNQLNTLKRPGKNSLEYKPFNSDKSKES